MVRAIRRAIHNGIVAATMVYGAAEIVSQAYELGEKTGYVVLEYGFPAALGVGLTPFVYLTVRAFDRDVVKNPKSHLNRFLDRFTYL